ncbi:MAG: tRNA (adenosine(37)-N6)-threonylcarbamoyltransferase complex ATPase subunit type 1 TsaE [Bernardetiaceae bacterium]|nr:tRNA (adenosine(37)-N6)-threonylcarbamoyltransferase complex ATPase subunit type 1 TsaE [Bernardetiaceae bacterium]
MELICENLAQLPAIARQVRNFAGPLRVWLMEGQLGAGKTALAQAVCRDLGVTDPVSSPTFAIVNQYATAQGQPVYHLDCYRLKNEAEALDIGVEEYLYSGHYCLIEWASRIQALWPPAYLAIDIALGPGQERRLNLTRHD